MCVCVYVRKGSEVITSNLIFSLCGGYYYYYYITRIKLSLSLSLVHLNNFAASSYADPTPTPTPKALTAALAVVPRHINNAIVVPPMHP